MTEIEFEEFLNKYELEDVVSEADIKNMESIGMNVESNNNLKEVLESTYWEYYSYYKTHTFQSKYDMRIKIPKDDKLDLKLLRIIRKKLHNIEVFDSTFSLIKGRKKKEFDDIGCCGFDLEAHNHSPEDRYLYILSNGKFDGMDELHDEYWYEDWLQDYEVGHISRNKKNTLPCIEGPTLFVMLRYGITEDDGFVIVSTKGTDEYDSKDITDEDFVVTKGISGFLIYVGYEDIKLIIKDTFEDYELDYDYKTCELGEDVKWNPKFNKNSIYGFGSNDRYLVYDALTGTKLTPYDHEYLEDGNGNMIDAKMNSFYKYHYVDCEFNSKTIKFSTLDLLKRIIKFRSTKWK